MFTDFAARKLILMLASFSFFVGLDSIITVPLLPMMAHTLSIPMEMGALLVTVYALVYMIFAPLFGVVSDRWGRKRMIVSGMLVLGVGTILTGFGFDFASLICCRAITGVGAAMLEPSIFALIGDKIPYEQRGRATGLVMGALIGSTLFGVPLGTYFAQIISWQWTFWGIGLLAITMIAALFAFLPPSEVTKAKDKGAAPTSFIAHLRGAMGNSSVLLALLSTFLWFGGLQGMFANIGVYYNQIFQLTTSQVGVVLMIAGFGSVVGNVIGGKLADQHGKKAVVGYASVLTAGGVLGISWITENVLLAVTVHLLWSTAFGLGHAALTALISELKPALRGTVLSLNSSAMYGGMMIATAVSVYLLHVGSFRMVGVYCAISALAVLPLVRFLKTKQPVAGSSHHQGL